MIVIRTLRKSDNYYDLVELTKEFYKEYELHNDLYLTDRISEKEIRKFFRDATKHGDEEAFVAVDNGKIVGFVLLSIEPRVPTFYRIKKIGLISIMMVDRAHRKSGMGSMLMERAKKWLKARKVEYVPSRDRAQEQVCADILSKEGL